MIKHSNVDSYISKYQQDLKSNDDVLSLLLNPDIYQDSSFNKESVVNNITNNISDAKELEHFKLSLISIMERLKSEILDTVNFNYNNFIVLMTKLNNIDFLIENIEKPLRYAEQKTQTSLELVSVYKSELTNCKNEISKIVLDIVLINLKLALNQKYIEIKQSFDNLDNKGGLLVSINKSNNKTYTSNNNNSLKQKLESLIELKLYNSDNNKNNTNNYKSSINLSFNNVEFITINDYYNSYQTIKKFLNSIYFISYNLKKFNHLYNNLTDVNLKIASIESINSEISLDENISKSIHQDNNINTVVIDDNDLKNNNHVIKDNTNANTDNNKDILYQKKYINEQEDKILNLIDKILIISIDELNKLNESDIINSKADNNENKKIKKVKLESFFSIIFQIYCNLSKENKLYTIINEKCIYVLIEKSLNYSNNTSIFSNKIKTLKDNYINIYSLFQNISNLNNLNLSFDINCLLITTLDKLCLNHEKTLVNCTDEYLFSDSYNALLNLLNYFLINQDNINKPILINYHALCNLNSKLVVLTNNFSFSTYFHLIQNEINKILIDDFSTNNQTLNNLVEQSIYLNKDKLIVLKEIQLPLNSYILNKTNYMINIINIIENLLDFKNNNSNNNISSINIFAKIIPDFMEYLCIIVKYISNKINSFYNSDCFIKILFYIIENNKTFSFIENNLISTRDMIAIFLINFAKLYSLFTMDIFDKLKMIIVRECIVLMNFDLINDDSSNIQINKNETKETSFYFNLYEEANDIYNSYHDSINQIKASFKEELDNLIKFNYNNIKLLLENKEILDEINKKYKNDIKLLILN